MPEVSCIDDALVENTMLDLASAARIARENEKQVGIIYYGSMENSIQEIDDILETEIGRKVNNAVSEAYRFTWWSNSFATMRPSSSLKSIAMGNSTESCEGAQRSDSRVHSAAYSDGMPPRARHYAELIKEVLKGAEE